MSRLQWHTLGVSLVGAAAAIGAGATTLQHNLCPILGPHAPVIVVCGTVAVVCGVIGSVLSSFTGAGGDSKS